MIDDFSNTIVKSQSVKYTYMYVVVIADPLIAKKKRKKILNQLNFAAIFWS